MSTADIWERNVNISAVTAPDEGFGPVESILVDGVITGKAEPDDHGH